MLQRRRKSVRLLTWTHTHTPIHDTQMSHKQEQIDVSLWVHKMIACSAFRSIRFIAVFPYLITWSFGLSASRLTHHCPPQYLFLTVPLLRLHYFRSFLCSVLSILKYYKCNKCNVSRAMDRKLHSRDRTAIKRIIPRAIKNLYVPIDSILNEKSLRKLLAFEQIALE